MTPDAAQEEGAMALFGEKYGDEVRVVSMGSDDDKSHGNYSIELCGGTHVSRTGDIGLLKIISESAVSSGVRRIEALTGEAARHYMNLQESILKKAAGVLKSSPSEVAERVEAILADRKSLEKQLAEAKKKLAMGGGSGPETIIEDVAGVKFHGQVLDGVSSKDLRGLADEAKKQMGSGVVVLIAVNDGKAGILVGVTDDLTGTHNAVNLVKVGTSTLGGKGGGGRPDMAQAGGPNGGDAAKALDAIKAEIAK
jgi:alanyl-tRNA synthetase